MKPASPSPDAYVRTFRQSAAVTPHASDEISTFVPRAILVGGAGNITGRLIGDTADTVFTLPAGIHNLGFQYIRAAGTSATGLVALT